MSRNFYFLLLSRPTLEMLYPLCHRSVSFRKINIFLGDLSFNSCQVGVRQGENLSPLLFSIYLSDLKEFLSRKCDGFNYIQNLATEFVDATKVVVFLKLHLLLYADDTVILTETSNDLQISLNRMTEYCKDRELSINVTKTQVMTFS